ncbi:MAG: hypothetical protein JKY57_01715 [Kordiimonadaceae bacterium]|nr:hypothetical protein [Kordiimonadaceae bacterium]
MQTIAVFDLLSHATMHLPFNAGYIKVLLAAFPDDEIILFADADHCENLKLELAGENRVKFTPQAGIATGQENLHSPITGTKAAKRCFDSVTKQLGKKKLRLAAMSGADSNLLRVFRSKWGKFRALHYIIYYTIT